MLNLVAEPRPDSCINDERLLLQPVYRWAVQYCLGLFSLLYLTKKDVQARWPEQQT